jgi:hypothetical protein
MIDLEPLGTTGPGATQEAENAAEPPAADLGPVDHLINELPPERRFQRLHGILPEAASVLLGPRDCSGHSDSPNA